LAQASVGLIRHKSLPLDSRLFLIRTMMRALLVVMVGLWSGTTTAAVEASSGEFEASEEIETGVLTRKVKVYQFMLPEKNTWKITSGKKEVCTGGPYSNWYKETPTNCKLPTGSYSITCCDTRSKEGWSGGYLVIEGEEKKICQNFTWGADNNCYSEQFRLVIPTPKPTPVPTPKPKPPLGASLAHVGLRGMWFTAPKVGMTCNQLCSSKGLVFDKANSKHIGNQAGKAFWPQKASGYNWVQIECSSTNTNHNWGANGGAPDGNWKHGACHVNCACKGR